MKHKKLIAALPLIAALSGCSTLGGFKAHKELKAPCGPVASIAENPCGAEVPLNIQWQFEGGRIVETV